MLVPCRRLPVRIHHVHWWDRHNRTFLLIKSELILVIFVIIVGIAFLLIWTAASLLTLCQQAKIPTIYIMVLKFCFISVFAHVIIEIGL